MLPPHNSRGRHAVEISTVFTVLAAITVTLRLYTRFFLIRHPGIEDYGILLAMVLLFATMKALTDIPLVLLDRSNDLYCSSYVPPA
jgi:hypothetical protein